MTTKPLKRVYFDSNILRNWPNASNELWNVLHAASWMKAELYFPKVVEMELEAQFVRGVQSSFEEMSSVHKRLRKRSHDVFAVEVTAVEPTEIQLREAFQFRSTQLKDFYKVSTIPIKTVGVELLVEMAINRDPPFEEVTIGKDRTGVVGLQDSAILFSIIAHTKGLGDERCALISNDAIFSNAETRQFVESCNLKLEIFRSLADLWKEMMTHILPAVTDPWKAEMKNVEDALNANKEQLTKQVVAFLNSTEFGTRAWNRAKEVKDVSVDRFEYVKTDLPDMKYLPPDSPVYSRPEGSEVKISAGAKLELRAIVERIDWIHSVLGDYQRPGTAPVLEETTLREPINVSLVGKVSNGVIGDFEITAIEPYKP